MKQAWGIITIVQEGRFRLVADDGRSHLFVLHRNASVEAQDLPSLVEGDEVGVAYTATRGVKALTAHEVRVRGRA